MRDFLSLLYDYVVASARDPKKAVPLAVLAALGCSSKDDKPYIPPLLPITFQVSPESPQINELFTVQLVNAGWVDLDIAADSTVASIPGSNDGIPDNDQEIIVDSTGFGTGMYGGTNARRVIARAVGERSSLDRDINILNNTNFNGASDALPPGVTPITLAEWDKYVKPFLFQDPNIPQDTVTQLTNIIQSLLPGETVVGYGANAASAWLRHTTALTGYTDTDGDGAPSRWVSLALNNTNPHRPVGALDDIISQAYTPQAPVKAWSTIAEYAPSLCVNGTPITPSNPLACEVIWPAAGASSIPMSLPSGGVIPVDLLYDWSIDGTINGPSVTVGLIYGQPDAFAQAAINLFNQTYKDPSGAYYPVSVVVMPPSGIEKISKLEIRKTIEADLQKHRNQTN